MVKEAEMTAKQRFKLKQFVKEVEGHRGRGTELVSVYVPAGYDLSKIIQHLAQEQGTATNIKSTATRKNVIDALERMIQHLKLYDRTPEHGLVAFAGNVSEREGQSDLQVWSIEPPVPLNQRLYRCDKEFIVEPLKLMAEDEHVFGMIVLDKREGSVALLKGKTIIPLTTATSAVPGKHKSGGQSAARFERLRDGAAKEFYRRIGDYANKEFLHREDIRGILLGGPGTSKEEFLEQGQMDQRLKDKIIATKDLSYTGEFGLHELLERCEDVLAEEEVMEEKVFMQRFFSELSKSTGLASYGKDEVMRVLKLGAVDVLLLSETLDDVLIGEFEAEAQAVGSDVQIISVETREGTQLKEIGKVAAVLRYQVDF
jgi:peptide chain release factor subunit 1